MAAEYRSAAVTAQVLTWGIAAGLPAPLLHTATRVVRDELDHAELSHGALVALGGEAEPVELTADALLLPPRAGLLDDLLRAALREHALGETLAVPCFAAMRRRATHPAVLPALDRILADEAAHRAFGWELLDALIALDPAVSVRAAELLPGLRESFRGYAHPVEAPPLSPDERACGLLDNGEYGELFARTWADDILPRLARRGVSLPV